VGRIVVNFDPAASPAAARTKRRRRWPKVLAVLAICFVVFIGLIAVGGFFAWRRFQSSPEYSVALLVDAAQRNDAGALAQRIDDDEIAKNMVATVSQKASARYGVAMNAATQQQIDKVMASSLPRLKQTIHDEVAKEIQRFSVMDEDKPFVYLLVTVPSLVNVTTEGDTAKVSTKRTDHPIEFTMRRDSDRWKVIALNDDALVQRIVDSMMKDLPAIGAFDSSNPLFKNPGKSRKKPR
jgi:hypothetical protein